MTKKELHLHGVSFNGSWRIQRLRDMIQNDELQSVANNHHENHDAIASDKELATTTFLPIYLDADKWVHPEELML